MTANSRSATGDEQARAGGLFCPRQIVRPLAAALLLALAAGLTLARLGTAPSPWPEGLDRYLANGWCQLMIAVFVASLLYGALQGLGLRVERHRLDQTPGAPPSPWRDWLAYVSGRESGSPDAPDARRLAGYWHGPQLGRAAIAQAGEMLLQVRARQHQHNFAPLGFAIWVLPLLGFIGTVVGITQAIGGLERTVAPEAAAASLSGVLGGLRFAFDTTLIGLVLVIPTMVLLLILRARAHRLDMLQYRHLLEELAAPRPESPALRPPGVPTDGRD